MSKLKKEFPKQKSKLHPRNRNKDRYDFQILIDKNPALAKYVAPNHYGDTSINFFDPLAVKTFNQAILIHHYNVDYWDIPSGYLCPPIPGRADYIHHIADLLSASNNNKIPKGQNVKCLDIGVGANCIYPLIGFIEYDWSFVGSDVDRGALQSAQKIIDNNKFNQSIALRFQANTGSIFDGIIKDNEFFDLTICNPPFHSSAEEAKSKASKKLKNLKKMKVDNPTLNFGGQDFELWYEGGEEKFITEIIFQSKNFATSCYWFSTLISKKANVKQAHLALEKVGAVQVKTVEMGQGNKLSRFVAWTFLNHKQQKAWKDYRWK